MSIIVILTLFPVAFMYSYFDGKLNTEDCPVMNMQILKSKLFHGFPFQNTKTQQQQNKKGPMFFFIKVENTSLVVDNKEMQEEKINLNSRRYSTVNWAPLMYADVIEKI